jgi:dTDP-4-dehydrorhamnose reductase
MAVKTAEHLGLDHSLLKKITVTDLQQPARRPLKTGFIIEKAKRTLGFSPLSFKEGLFKTFQE